MVFGIRLGPDAALLLGEPVEPVIGMTLGLLQGNLEGVDVSLQDRLVREGADSGIVGVESCIHATFTVVLRDDLEGAILRPVMVPAPLGGCVGLTQVAEEWRLCFCSKVIGIGPDLRDLNAHGSGGIYHDGDATLAELSNIQTVVKAGLRGLIYVPDYIEVVLRKHLIAREAAFHGV